nr:immunoglobulin light chain junction region [Macaca mulatta]MOX69645.1 immunoglobulin light chain junction region [Macaca mulatta]MOX70503.1 immunoglobulin light chain junction region [Macaca mulatta]MOX71087.1 immunoglobulin light chain junction region [Macaca mulatta]MOX71145.1 immunoglobulin light chain junction region [Macaca mulatta]
DYHCLIWHDNTGLF